MQSVSIHEDVSSEAKCRQLLGNPWIYEVRHNSFALWRNYTSHLPCDEAIRHIRYMTKLYVSSVLVDQRRITSWCRLPRETNNWSMWTPIKVLFVWKSWASRWCIRSTEKKYMLKEQTSASVPFLSSLFNKKCVSKFGCYLSLNATPSLRCQSRRSSHIPNKRLVFLMNFATWS